MFYIKRSSSSLVTPIDTKQTSTGYICVQGFKLDAKRRGLKQFSKEKKTFPHVMLQETSLKNNEKKINVSDCHN